MEPSISFAFRNKHYTALFTICERELPTFIYITLLDDELVKEFGEEVVMHCSNEGLLTERIYTDHREALYKAIFAAIMADSRTRLNNTSHVNQQ